MNFGKWRCTIPDCDTRKQGIIFFSSDPSYAYKTCDTCGAPLNRISGPDMIYLVGDSDKYSKNVLKAGILPIQFHPQTDIDDIKIHRSIASLDDPDVDLYPNLDEAVVDPTLFAQDIYDYLQTTDLFLAKSDGVAVTVIVARCPSHHLSVPISHVPYHSLHMEVHRIGDYDVFGIYPLLWDNCYKPWYTEHTIIPYDEVGVNDEEVSQFIYGYRWRKLFYILTQEITPLVLIDENHKVVGVREIRKPKRHATKFRSLLERLGTISERQIAKQEDLNTGIEYNNAVPIDEIRSRFPKMEDVCNTDLYLENIEYKSWNVRTAVRKIKFHFDWTWES